MSAREQLRARLVTHLVVDELIVHHADAVPTQHGQDFAVALALRELCRGYLLPEAAVRGGCSDAGGIIGARPTSQTLAGGRRRLSACSLLLRHRRRAFRSLLDN